VINTANNNTCTVTLNNCNATGNVAAVSGGFLYGTNCRVFVNNSTISGNSAKGTTSTNGGGAFYLYSASNLTLNNTTVASHSVAATARGGAINVKLVGYSGTMTIATSTIVDNGSSGTNLAAAGGGIWCDGTSAFKLVVSNSIIAKNRATAGPDLKTDSSTTGT